MLKNILGIVILPVVGALGLVLSPVILLLIWINNKEEKDEN